jgi:hypothetical protein
MGKWLNMGIWEVRSPTRLVKLKPCCNHPKVVENQGDMWLQIFQDFDILLMRVNNWCVPHEHVSRYFKILLWCSLWTHRNTPQKLSNVVLVNEASEALGDEKSPTRNGSIPEEPTLGWRTGSCAGRNMMKMAYMFSMSKTYSNRPKKKHRTQWDCILQHLGGLCGCWAIPPAVVHEFFPAT